jgi:hypothetical protein
MEAFIKMTIGTFYECFLTWPKNFFAHAFELQRVRFYRQNRKPASEPPVVDGEEYDAMLMKVFLAREQINNLDYWSFKLEKDFRIRGTLGGSEIWTQVMDSLR